MMSAETIRRIKRNYELQKTSALRQRLQVKASKKAKCVIGIPTISGIISEPVPKSATHFSLKAIAYKGEHSFVSLSAMDIKFIMMGYDGIWKHDVHEIHHDGIWKQKAVV